jgi:sortase A
MRDKRTVDELSIEELERILAIRRRAARQERLERLREQGRRVAAPEPVPAAALPVEPAPEPFPRQHEAAAQVEPVEPPVSYDLTDEVPRFEDDLDDDIVVFDPKAPKPKPSPQAAAENTRRRAVMDRLLLVVEVVAVLGIVGVLVVGGYLVMEENDKIDALEEKSAAIQQEAAAMVATPTPAPELRVSSYVLPGGHYSPLETGGVGVFNYDEIPESVRPAIAAQLAVPRAPLPTPSADSPAPGRVEIPRLGVDATIYVDDWFSLQKGVGHYPDSANPGERANMVLTAHNDIYGKIFKDIGLLEPGDEVRVQARNGRWYTYAVTGKEIVDPDDIWVLERDVSEITLITCHPYQVDTHRMIVFGELVEGAS